MDGFRFDLAASPRARGERLRLRTARSSSGRPGSRALRGQADRRAVGHRRLRPRPVPGRLERVERQVPRHRARLLAWCRGSPPGLATRISGSRDLYGHGGRRPTASVNIVTVHDGFTLADLVSYDGKHNEANGEDNRDGTDDNRSWNCGVEGPTDDAAVLELRARQRRNFLATLLLSEGVPLLLGGDEFARTQGGNNNAYCHDDELSWFDWNAVAAERGPGRLHGASVPPARGAPGVPAPPVLPRHAGPRLGSRRPRLVPPRRRRDDRAGLGCLLRAGRDDGAERRHRRRPPGRTIRSCCCSTRGGSRSTSRSPRRSEGSRGRSRSTRAPQMRPDGRSTRRPRSR